MHTYASKKKLLIVVMVDVEFEIFILGPNAKGARPAMHKAKSINHKTCSVVTGTLRYTAY